MLGWIMDVVLCLMLLAALTGGFILNRRLVALRNDRSHMEAMIRTLTNTVTQTEGSVRALKDTAAEVEESLRERVSKARALADELVIITQAGEDLAAGRDAVLCVDECQEFVVHDADAGTSTVGRDSPHRRTGDGCGFGDDSRGTSARSVPAESACHCSDPRARGATAAGAAGVGHGDGTGRVRIRCGHQNQRPSSAAIDGVMNDRITSVTKIRPMPMVVPT